MSHTAAELFPGWYNKGVNRDANPEEIALRRNAIKEILSLSDKLIWNNFLKVYLGLAKFGSNDYTDIVEHFKKGDENFSIQDENLVRLLCGCAIVHKIEENSSYISDWLALSLVTTTVLSLKAPLIEEMRSRAYTFWIEEAESKRDMNIDFPTGTGAVKSVTKIAIPEPTTNDPATFKTQNDALIKVITAIQKELNATNGEAAIFHNALESIKKNFIALAEETNILWWLFGAYSSTLKQPFKTMTPELLSIIVSLELRKLTKSLPGIGGIESIIQKALSNVEYEVGVQNTIESIVDSVVGHEEQLKTLMPVEKAEIQYLTPILYAVRCHSDFAGGEWKAIYKKHFAFDLASKITYENIALQLYQELMLAEVYENINN